jgi:hypothetical protein
MYAGIFITPSETETREQRFLSNQARCAPTLDTVAFKSLLISTDIFLELTYHRVIACMG